MIKIKTKLINKKQNVDIIFAETEIDNSRFNI